MGQIGFNPVANFFSNIFKPKKTGANTVPYNPLQPLQTAGLPGNSIPGYNFTPYQIRTADTFEKIAETNNMTVQQLQQANNGMLVPPPKGSYINLPYRSSTPVVPGMNQQLTYNQSRGPGANSFTSGGNVNLGELTSNITKQLQGGQLPGSIPYQVTKSLVNPTTGKPFSDADFRAEGYQYNNVKQQWELPGANTASNQPAQQTANQPAYLQTVNYNGTLMPAWEAQLREKRAARKARERAMAAAAMQGTATNAGGLPATTLDVQIGGG